MLMQCDDATLLVVDIQDKLLPAVLDPQGLVERAGWLISAANDYYSMSAPGDGDADTLIFRPGHGHDTVLAFDVGVDVLDLGGRDYPATDTAAGTLLTAGRDTILLAGIHDFEV